MSPDRDDLLTRLSALTVHDVPADRRARIAAVCRGRLAHSAGRPALLLAVRWLEPLAVGLLAVIYLSWAVERALVLLGLLVEH